MSEVKQDPTMIWKFDTEGNERPLQEQLDRRKEDLRITLEHIAWYNKYPLHKNVLRRAKAKKDREEHLANVQRDIARLEKLLKDKTDE